MKYIRRFIVLIFVCILCFSFFSVGLIYGKRVENGEISLIEPINPTKVERLKQIIRENFLFDYDENKLNTYMYKGIFEGLEDPYSEYLTKEEYMALQEDVQGEFEGIGVVVTKDGDYIQVVSPVDGSPAAKAGIKAGDYITAIDGESYSAASFQEATKRMRGLKGSEVTVTVQRKKGNSFETLEFTLIRDTIPLLTVSSEMLDEQIAYLRISSFDSNTAKEFKTEMEKVLQKNAKAVILDLRSNPGGLVDAGTRVADMLLPEGDIVHQRDKKGNETVISSDKNYYDIPLAVLVDEGTASSSEILTGALKDYNRGIIIGKNTYGKGIVQRFWELNDGSGAGVKITVAEFFTPKKNKIHKIGIQPDIEIDLPKEAKGIGPKFFKEDTQLQKAIEIIREKTETKNPL